MFKNDSLPTDTAIPVYRDDEHHHGFVIVEYPHLSYQVDMDATGESQMEAFVQQAIDMGANTIINYKCWGDASRDMFFLEGTPVKLIF